MNDPDVQSHSTSRSYWAGSTPARGASPAGRKRSERRHSPNARKAVGKRRMVGCSSPSPRLLHADEADVRPGVERAHQLGEGALEDLGVGVQEEHVAELVVIRARLFRARSRWFVAGDHPRLRELALHKVAGAVGGARCPRSRRRDRFACVLEDARQARPEPVRLVCRDDRGSASDRPLYPASPRLASSWVAASTWSAACLLGEPASELAIPSSSGHSPGSRGNCSRQLDVSAKQCRTSPARYCPVTRARSPRRGPRDSAWRRR